MPIKFLKCSKAKGCRKWRNRFMTCCLGKIFWTAYDCSKYRKVSQLRSSHLWRNHLLLLSLSIVIRNGKIVRKRGPNCYFHLNLKFLGGHAGNTSKQQKIVAFVRNYLVKMTLKTVLFTFGCYDYGTNASEAVQKTASNRKEYHKCSLCVTVCWIAKIYQ